MLHPAVPLTPKQPGRPLRALVLGRISTPHQDEENIQASYRYVEDHLRRLYDGPLEVRHLGEQASGMLVDRATIREADALITSGTWDLVIAEDLSRIYRNPRHQYDFVQDAVDARTRVICIADNLDTADDNWEIMLGAATLRHGMTVPDVRRRVRRTATHAFHRGGMVLKVKFGYRKLTTEEAAAGTFGPPGLRIAKRPECTPIIIEMKDRILRGDSYEAVAEWLRAEGVESPPYARRWTARLVKSLLVDPLLCGSRRFRNVVHQLVYRTGRYRRVRNAEPEESHHPELAHLTCEEHHALLSVIRERERAHRRPSGPDHPLTGRPRRRTIWPGQHAQCAVCKGLMYRIGADLKCRNTLAKGRSRCWNRVQVRSSVARDKILGALLETAEHSSDLRSVLVEAVQEELERSESRSRQARRKIEREIADRQRQADNLAEAIARGGRLDVLVQRLADVNDQLSVLRHRLARSTQPTVSIVAGRPAPKGSGGLVSGEARPRSGRSLDEPPLADRQAPEGARPVLHSADLPGKHRMLHEPPWTAPEATDTFESLLASFARTSHSFADFLRALIPEFCVRPVQALDTFQVRPRAELVLRLPRDERQDTKTSRGHRTLVVDLFDPPLHIRHADACRQARREMPEATLDTLAERLALNRMTVKRALDYGRRMERAGWSDPYRELDGPPARASRWTHGTKRT